MSLINYTLYMYKTGVLSVWAIDRLLPGEKEGGGGCGCERQEKGGSTQAWWLLCKSKLEFMVAYV